MAAEFFASTDSEEDLVGEILGKHGHLADPLHPPPQLFEAGDRILREVGKVRLSGGDDIYRALYTEFHAVGSFDMRDAPSLEVGDIDAEGSQ